MDISKEHFEALVNNSRETSKRSNRRSAAVMIALRVLGLAFVAGAVIIVFSLPVGVIVCAAAALLFIALYYIEIHSEKNDQLSLYHMILTKSSFAAVSKYRSEGCTDGAVGQLEAVLDTETDPRRKAVLGDMLSEAHILRGKRYETAPIDEELIEEDRYFEILSLFHTLRDNILSEDRASLSYSITAAYDSISEIMRKNETLTDDTLTAAKLIDAEILMSYFREDYFRCVEYIDTRLSCGDIFSDGKSDSPYFFGYIILKIRCLYYIGKYDEARRLCGDILPRVSAYEFLLGQAKELWELLN
ncbi:MAG: hypothetical protein SOU50_07275 [Oscillospiraceae bacterium]|nr:hypothetical protein [Oscillospiraceae bacterium]MDY2848002.1 hypothetical protein [Oscillospiraceae bacterium]